MSGGKFTCVYTWYRRKRPCQMGNYRGLCVWDGITAKQYKFHISNYFHSSLEVTTEHW